MNDIMKAILKRKKKTYDEILEFELKMKKIGKDEIEIRDDSEKIDEKMVNSFGENVKINLRKPKLNISRYCPFEEINIDEKKNEAKKSDLETIREENGPNLIENGQIL